MQPPSVQKPLNDTKTTPPENVVAFAPKVNKDRYLIYILLLILAPGLIALAIFSIRKISPGFSGISKVDQTKNIPSEERIIWDDFSGQTINNDTWDVGAWVDRTKAFTDNGRLVMEIIEPENLGDAPDVNMVTLIAKKSFINDFEISADIDATAHYGHTSFKFILQKDREVFDDNRIWLTVTPAYDGVRIGAGRLIEGDEEDLGSKLFERTRNFKVQILRNDSKVVFRVNGEHLAETEKIFAGGVFHLVTALYSYPPQYTGAKIYLDNILVNSQ